MEKEKLDELVKLLTDAVKSALEAQASHSNTSFVMQGKGMAYQEVLNAVNTLTGSEEYKSTEKPKDS